MSRGDRSWPRYVLGVGADCRIWDDCVALRVYSNQLGERVYVLSYRDRSLDVGMRAPVREAYGKTT